MTVDWSGRSDMYGCYAHKHRDMVPVDVHHVHPLSEGGADVVANTVMLCPNAHRRVHDYIRLLKKHNGQVPWLKRKFFGEMVRYVAIAGYGAIKVHNDL